MQNTAKTTDVTGREISITRLLNAPIKLVWEVWTKPEHIQHWWGPVGFTNTIHKMEVKPNGMWEFIMHGPDGMNFRNETIFIEIKELEKIVYDHLSGPKFRATVSFTDKGDKTLLHFSMVFETVEQKERTEREFGASQGQKQTIDRLELYLESHKNMDKKIIVTRLFNAPITRVWRALTDAEEMKKWYFNISAFKCEPGFEFSFEGGNENRIYHHLCKIIEVIPGRKLVHSWRYQGFEGNSTLSFELSELGPQTRLILTHAGLETLPPNNPDFDRKNFEKGWDYIIHQSLENFLKNPE